MLSREPPCDFLRQIYWRAGRRVQAHYLQLVVFTGLRAAQARLLGVDQGHGAMTGIALTTIIIGLMTATGVTLSWLWDRSPRRHPPLIW